MKKVNLKNCNISGNHFTELSVIMDDSETIIILPLLYSIYLYNVGEVIKYKIHKEDNKLKKTLVSEPLADTSITNYINKLYQFLKYVNLNDDLPNVHHSYLIKPSQLRNYLAEHIAQNSGAITMDNHKSALQAYFNFLAYLRIRQPHIIKVSRNVRKKAFENNRLPNKINYITSSDRQRLLNQCDCMRDRIIIRLGFEAGLRSSECRGVLLKNKYVQKGSLLDLFDQVKDPAKYHINKFEYLLLGKYAKGGESRIIYFSRELLVYMKKYYFTERANVLGRTNDEYDPDSLLVNNDQVHFGKPISKRLPSDVFSKYREEIEGFNPRLSFHDLRHTFATELYHDELQIRPGRETRSESAALLVVAQRLGHKLGKDGKAQHVTTRYIRMREQMLQMEDGL
jgi:integrase